MADPRSFSSAYGKMTVAQDSTLVCKVCQHRIATGDAIVWVVIRRSGGSGMARTGRPVYIHEECEGPVTRRVQR